jgi:macrolide transport system ATP-binding/permease protein
MAARNGRLAPCKGADPDLARWGRRLGVSPTWRNRWGTLSHGERKRAQLACLLWRNPDILLVDEPTNHLDAESGDLVRQALAAFSGTGLLVSHDRELLDAICRRVAFLEPPEVTLVPGSYSSAVQDKHTADEHRVKERQRCRRELGRLETEQHRRLAEAQRSDSRRSKRHLHRHDADGRAKINLARLTGKDGVAGKLARQAQGRLSQAQERLAGLKVRKEYDLSFTLVDERSPRDTLVRLTAGAIPLGGDRSLAIPDLCVSPHDRIGITGPNGSGKSTLLRHLLDHLALPPGRLLYLPQEIELAEGAERIATMRALPSDRRGEVLAFVSCLGTRPERLLAGDQPSPGEIRKLHLALGLSERPWLIIMDEPTNHLDLPAVELLEAALERLASALILVSHDRPFLTRLTTTHWHCRREINGSSCLLQLAR